MSAFDVTTAATAGPARSGQVVHLTVSPKLVLFPGETLIDDRHAEGRIYIVGGGSESYVARGGPPTRYPDRGHWAVPTPAGTYRLGPQHHHVTNSWPMSCIPWDANLRVGSDQEIEFETGGIWLRATGSYGRFTKLWLAESAKRLGRPLTMSEKVQVNQACRRLFYDTGGTLMASWTKNDFGKWAWNLFRGGAKTVYYVHTTPDDELATVTPGATVSLDNSHGCVHLRPADRDEMMTKGYLKKGRIFEVRPYGVKGPP